MKLFVLLFSVSCVIPIFAQQDLYYAMPVGQDLSNEVQLSYGQKVNVDFEDWANSNMDWIMIENGNENLELQKNFFLPFAPPAKNISMAEYAMNEEVLDFSFEAEVAGDWKENKTLTIPGGLSAGQVFTIMKSLFEKPLRSVEELPTKSMNYSNYNLGEVYMTDVIIMDDYEHYVFYLNGSGEWLHSIQMILDSQKENKIVRTRYKVSSAQSTMEHKLYYVISDDTPYYSTSSISKSQKGTLKTNDELFSTPSQLVSASHGLNTDLEFYLKNGKKIRIAEHYVLPLPAPVRSKSLKEYASLLHQLGLKTDYYTKQWIQDQQLFAQESLTLPTNNFASATLLMSRIYPQVKDHLSILPNGMIIKKTESVEILKMESGSILQISVKDIGNEKSLGMVLDENGNIKVLTQKI